MNNIRSSDIKLNKFYLSIAKISLFLILLLSCGRQQVDENLTTILYSRISLHKDRMIVKGVVTAPGFVAYGKVTVTTVPSSGSCVTGSTINPLSTILGTGSTDSGGQYMVSYISIGTPICLVVTPSQNSYMTSLIPKTKVTTTISWLGSRNVSAIYKEPVSYASSSRGVDGVYKFLNVSPFTTIAERRFVALRLQNPTTETTNLILLANLSVRKSFFYGDTSLLEEIEPSTEKSTMRLGAIIALADSKGGVTNGTVSDMDGKSDGIVTADDIDSVVSYMKEDFSDGKFDSKKVNDSGTTISLVSSDYFGTIISTNASSFLTLIYYNAVDLYLQGDDNLPDTLITSQTFCNDSSTCVGFLFIDYKVIKDLNLTFVSKDKDYKLSLIINLIDSTIYI